MPVRDIPKKYSNVSGRVAAEKRVVSYQFESTLERDALFLYDMDETVELVEEQPVAIPYTSNGKKKIYTPDLLVIYQEKTKFQTKLIEIKYKAELEQKKEQLKVKFDAANKYCKERGWVFCVLTEEDIRTDKLDNLKFLKNYKYQKFKLHSYETIKNTLAGEKKAISEVLEMLKMGKREKACILADIWMMVLRGYLSCNMNEKLTMSTEISVSND